MFPSGAEKEIGGEIRSTPLHFRPRGIKLAVYPLSLAEPAEFLLLFYPCPLLAFT